MTLDESRGKLSAWPIAGSEIRDRSAVYRILVVDDDKDSSEVLSYILAQARYEVRIALDATEAFLTIDHFNPDVALIDIGLTLAGYELAESIRARP